MDDPDLEDGEPVTEGVVVESSIEELKNALYARCANQSAEKLFNQDDLMNFGVIPNNELSKLVMCTNRLSKEGLIKLHKKDDVLCWKVVKKEDAAKYKHLSPDEALAYAYVEAAGRDGVWVKALRLRTNLHQTVLNRSLKSLETKGYIKPTKTVKFPNRKFYMLASLQPSEAATGGAFYTDGFLDEEFIDIMSTWTERYIIGRSWWHPPMSDGSKKKDKGKPSREQAERLREYELEKGHIGRERSLEMLPMPPGYQGYPTVSEITRALNASGLSGVIMKEAEMTQLLNVLGWDGKIEIVPDSKGYRAVRRVTQRDDKQVSNGLPEAPCCRCPVFEVCEDNGPVNAKTCEYFEDWLNIL